MKIIVALSGLVAFFGIVFFAFLKSVSVSSELHDEERE